MSAPGTPAPPASPVVPVENVEAAGEDQGAVNHSLADGDPITVQPQDGVEGGPEFTTLPSETPQPIVEEAPAEPSEPPKKPTWVYSLFGCFDMDIKLLGLTMCCPCITFGANAELLGEDWMLYCLFCMLPGPMCYFGPYIRQKIRTTFEIEGSDEEDVLTYLLCPCLAIIQETQQLKSAGMKPGGEAMNRA